MTFRRLPLASALAVVVAVSLVGAPTSDARRVSRTVRIEGYVAPAPEGTRAEAKWTVNAGKKSVTIEVTKLRIVSGTGAPSDVIQALKPYRAAAFRIAAADEDLEKIAAAPAGSRIELQGALRLSPARTLLLSSFEIDR